MDRSALLFNLSDQKVSVYSIDHDHAKKIGQVKSGAQNERVHLGRSFKKLLYKGSSPGSGLNWVMNMSIVYGKKREEKMRDWISTYKTAWNQFRTILKSGDAPIFVAGSAEQVGVFMGHLNRNGFLRSRPIAQLIDVPEEQRLVRAEHLFARLQSA